MAGTGNRQQSLRLAARRLSLAVRRWLISLHMKLRDRHLCDAPGFLETFVRTLGVRREQSGPRKQIFQVLFPLGAR